MHQTGHSSGVVHAQPLRQGVHPTLDGTTNDQAPVVKTHFTAIDGTKLVITCTKGEDGKYLVTAAQKE